MAAHTSSTITAVSPRLQESEAKRSRDSMLFQQERLAMGEEDRNVIRFLHAAYQAHRLGSSHITSLRGDRCVADNKLAVVTNELAELR